MKILNAFALSMVSHPAKIMTEEITLEQAKTLLKDLESVVGHKETAEVLTGLLGVPVAFNRATVALTSGEAAVVAQYVGPRLVEGATSLPAGAKMIFVKVSVQ